jgi:hypothetical protein
MDLGAFAASPPSIGNDDFAARVKEGRELNQQLLCSADELNAKFGVKHATSKNAPGFGGTFQGWSEEIPSTDVTLQFNAVSKALRALTVGKVTPTPIMPQEPYLTHRHVNAKIMPDGHSIPITITKRSNIPNEVSNKTNYHPPSKHD